MGRKGKEDPWSFHDDAVLYAAVVVGAVLDGAAQYLQPCPTPFPPQIEGERALAQGGFTLYTLRAQGDGTYVHQSGMMLATGRGALPLMAGVAAVQAIGTAVGEPVHARRRCLGGYLTMAGCCTCPPMGSTCRPAPGCMPGPGQRYRLRRWLGLLECASREAANTARCPGLSRPSGPSSSLFSGR